MSPLELFAAIVTALSIWLATRQNLVYWPTAVASVLLYGWIYWQFRLYAEAGLQVVWLILIVYGWVQWLHGGENRAELPVTKTPRQWWPFIVIAGLAMSAAIAVVQLRWTDNPAPLVDSSIAAWSIVAQWMLARKWIENWILWTVINIVAVPLYLTRAMWGTAALYAVVLVLGIRGWFAWRKSLASA